MDNDLPKSYINKFVLNNLTNTSTASICLSKFTIYDYDKTMIFHPQEKEFFENLKFDKRIKSFLIGRYAAKNAVSSLTGEKRLNKIIIQNGIWGQPIIEHTLSLNIQVSITHCCNYGIALAFFEAYPMGIDMEFIDINRCKLIESYLTDSEKSLISQIPYDYSSALTLFWTAKESLSKILKTGLTTPLHVFSLKSIETSHGVIINYYDNFTQYATLSFKLNEYMVSITYPKNLQLNFNVNSFKEKFLQISSDII